MLQSKSNILFINTESYPPYLVQHPQVDSSFQRNAAYKNLGTTDTDSYSKTSGLFYNFEKVPFAASTQSLPLDTAS